MIDILQLPGWKFSGLGQDGNCLVIEATYTQADEACHKCGSIGVLYKHGTKEVNCHLAAHLIAVKQQTEASAASLQSIVGRPRLEP